VTPTTVSHTESAPPAPAPNGAGDPRLGVLTTADQELVWTVATLLTDAVQSFAVSVTQFLYERLTELPKDDALVTALEDHAYADAHEVLSTLRAGMGPMAHETPVEALAHARYLRQRGVGLQSLVAIYKYGFSMFRELLAVEIRERATDPAQAARILAAADAYSFPFVGKAMHRLAVEFGSFDGGWRPTPDDPVLADEASLAQAHRLREEQLARGSWLARSPELSRARQDAEETLRSFVALLEEGVSTKGLDDRLALASTTVAITLADEPDLSTTLLLDRSPIEIVDGAVDSEARMWIASVDLRRMWWGDFYLPMAIAKGRVRVSGPIRKFLRVVPILRAVGEPAVAEPRRRIHGSRG
jgi:hypothetical protein